MISFTKRTLPLLVVRRVGTSTALHAQDTARHCMSRHVTTRTTCRAHRVVTYRDVTQQVEFGLNW